MLHPWGTRLRRAMVVLWCHPSCEAVWKVYEHRPWQHGKCHSCAPVVVEGRLRLAFIATKPIQAGDEITWDYGVRGEPWLSKQGNTLVNTNTKHFICMRSYPATHLAPRWRYALKPLQTIPCFNQSDQQSYHFLLGSTQQPIPTQDQGILSTSQVVNAPTTLLTTAYIHENMLSVYQCW